MAVLRISYKFGGMQFIRNTAYVKSCRKYERMVYHISSLLLKQEIRFNVKLIKHDLHLSYQKQILYYVAILYKLQILSSGFSAKCFSITSGSVFEVFVILTPSFAAFAVTKNSSFVSSP